MTQIGKTHPSFSGAVSKKYMPKEFLNHFSGDKFLAEVAYERYCIQKHTIDKQVLRDEICLYFKTFSKLPICVNTRDGLLQKLGLDKE